MAEDTEGLIALAVKHFGFDVPVQAVREAHGQLIFTVQGGIEYTCTLNDLKQQPQAAAKKPAKAKKGV